MAQEGRVPGSCLVPKGECQGSRLKKAASVASRALKSSGRGLNFAVWMLSREASLARKSNSAIVPACQGRKTEVRSPQTVRRQSEILVSRTGFPSLCVKKLSRNCNVDV